MGAVTGAQLAAFIGLAVVSLDPFGALLALACFRRDPRRRTLVVLAAVVVAVLWVVALLAGRLVTALLRILTPWLAERPVEDVIQSSLSGCWWR